MLSDTQKGLTETRDYSSRRGRRGSSQAYAFGVPSATMARPITGTRGFPITLSSVRSSQKPGKDNVQRRG